jgi:taurine dioxygenase
MRGSFGAYAEEVDVGSLSSASADALARSLYRYKVLVIQDQHLDEATYAEFGRHFGEPIRFFAPEHREHGHPELIRVTNSPRTPAALRDGAMHWHADSSYESVAAFVTMLYAVEAPTTGNDTMFADTQAAYEALPEQIKGQIADLLVAHDPRGGRVPLLDGEVRGDSSSSTLPVVEHPLVMRHPMTGRASLYGFGGTACGIVGWDDETALELLWTLKRHVLRDRFRQRARAETGSILVWDNYSVVHCATPTTYSDEPGQRRRLLRISTRYRS